MRRPRCMNKRQAKKWRKYCEEAEYLNFMTGVYPSDLWSMRKIRNYLDNVMAGVIKDE